MLKESKNQVALNTTKRTQSKIYALDETGQIKTRKTSSQKTLCDFFILTCASDSLTDNSKLYNHFSFSLKKIGN